MNSQTVLVYAFAHNVPLDINDRRNTKIEPAAKCIVDAAGLADPGALARGFTAGIRSRCRTIQLAGGDGVIKPLIGVSNSLYDLDSLLLSVRPISDSLIVEEQDGMMYIGWADQQGGFHPIRWNTVLEPGWAAALGACVSNISAGR
jgi:hypothetical protein